jgi:biopolymer transport protein ExbB
MAQIFSSAWQNATDFLALGGVVIWIIAGLSVLTVAVILWRLIMMWVLGVWGQRQQAELAIRLWRSGQAAQAKSTLNKPKTVKSRIALTAISASCAGYTRQVIEAEVLRVAKSELAEARRGLKLLELIGTIAPLLGLLGTVIGMITAFQAMQEAGSNVDPTDLAGGIWEALLTTAAGMAVAIPATMGLVWFESQIEKLALAIEDIATRLMLPVSDGRNA